MRRQGRSQSRRYFLGMLLLVTIAILSFSSIPLARAEEESVEAAVDGAEEPEDVAAVPDEAVEIDAEEEEAEEQEEEQNDVVEADLAEPDDAAVEEETAEVDSFLKSQQAKISGIIEKVKEISPQQKKKIAAGAIGIWGVAAGAGWVLNNLGGSDE